MVNKKYAVDIDAILVKYKNFDIEQYDFKPIKAVFINKVSFVNKLMLTGFYIVGRRSRYIHIQPKATQIHKEYYHPRLRNTCLCR